MTEQTVTIPKHVYAALASFLFLSKTIAPGTFPTVIKNLRHVDARFPPILDRVLAKIIDDFNAQVQAHNN